MAWVSAPAESSALVASASRRPVMPLPERTEIEARTSLPSPAARQVVGDVEADRAVGREREALAAGLVDLDVEADAAAGEAAGDAGAGPGHQARRVEVVDVEGERRPARHRVGVGEHVEHGLGAGVDGGGGGPGLHDAERSHRAAPVSSAWETILPGPLDDAGPPQG